MLRFRLLKKLMVFLNKEWAGEYVRYFNDVIQSFIRSKNGEKPRLSKLTSQLKGSSTVFILGSGSSINSITSEEWELIRNADSFACNFFLAADLRPSLYFFETGWDEKLTDLFYDWRRSKKQEDIPLILNGNLIEDRVWYDLPDFKNRYYHYPYSIRSGKKPFVRHVLAQKWLRPLDSVDKSIHHGASVSFLIDIARIMGYKNIVLVGVDLEGPYFQSDYKDKFSLRLKGLSEAINEMGSHATSVVCEEDNFLPIQELIPLMQETVLTASNTRLFQMRKCNLLPTVPLFNSEVCDSDDS